MLEGSTLWELIEKRAEASPDRLMAVDENERELTFADYRNQCEVAAAGLAGRGIGAGDVVTWQLPTWLESMVLVGALARLGAIQNPILHIYREREVGFCVNQAGTKLLVVPTEFGGFGFGEMAAGIVADNPGCEVLIADRELPVGDPSTLPAPPSGGDDVRWLFYTSGTTADPKGAQHTDQTVSAMARGMAEYLQITEDDRNALVFPFTHIGGIGWLFTSLLTGCGNIFVSAFVPDMVVEVLGREGVTLGGAGTVFHQVYLGAQTAADAPIFPEVRGFPGGGSPKPPQLHYDMVDAFGAGILSGYGLTEAPILTMAKVGDADEDLANSEGSAMPGVDLKLVSIDGDICDIGDEGEVRARAPQLMKGYLDAGLNEVAFDEAGYFRTGDLGRLNERGMLTITGRLKDVIIRKGENVSAKEVEDELYKHPKVGDVAVIGLPDERSGERVCAIIQTAQGQDDIGFDEMSEFLRGEGLMVQKLPEQLEIIDAIPRNPAGKIPKHELKKQYTD